MIKRNEAIEIIDGIIEKIESSISSPLIKKIHFEFEEEERKRNMQKRNITRGIKNFCAKNKICSLDT